MALVRVYCGISSTASVVEASHSLTDQVTERLTVAVVDDAGRLLEFCEINDDPAGYALVTSLLVERVGGSSAISVAADSDDHLVTSLLATASRALAYVDDDTVDDYADRFADDESLDEVHSGPAERRALGLARALQAGALSAVAVAAPREVAAFKPVLAAHAALLAGRHAAAVALREVLRELYPAALRAYPDPAEAVALGVLEALPEPSMLASPATSRGRESVSTAETVAARLVADGICDSATALEAVTALRVAIAETPRRSGIGKQLTGAVAESVRHSVAAVRSSDAGCAALIGALTERVGPAVVSATPAPARRTAMTITSAPPAQGSFSAPSHGSSDVSRAMGSRRRVHPAPVAATPPVPQPVQPPPVAPAPVTPPPTVPQPVSWNSQPPVPPGFEPTPITGSPMVTRQPMPQPIVAQSRPTSGAPQGNSTIPAQRSPLSPAESGAPFVPLMTNAAINSERAARTFPASPTPLTVEQVPIPVAPVSAAPVSAAPVSAAPVSVAPVYEAPVSAAPVSVAPVYAAPVSVAPVYEAPVYEAPVSVAPVQVTPLPVAPVPVTPLPAAPPAIPPMPTRLRERQPSTPTDIPAPLPPPMVAPVAAPGSRANWPLIGDSDDQAFRGHSDDQARRGHSDDQARRGHSDDEARRGHPDDQARRGHSDDEALRRHPDDQARRGPERVKPPWQADDLVLPDGVPLRLVEPVPDARRMPDELDGPPLRLVDEAPRNGRLPKQRRTERAAPEPVTDDTDLLIFASVSSAWFAGEDDSESTWNSDADTGWRAAEQAARPAVGDDTTAGLPRRVPQANLVPGSPIAAPERPLRIVRDAAGIAAHTSNYFRGWRRGQEVGGYSVGGRPGRESAAGWDFSREPDTRGPDPRDLHSREPDPRDLDPRDLDPRDFDPRGMDPRGQDQRGQDPRGHDPRGRDGRDHRSDRPERDDYGYRAARR